MKRAPRGERSRPTLVPSPPAEDLGMVNGEPVERYDPSRDDIMLLLGKSSPGVRANLEAAGWELRGGDGRRELWGRDRVEAARSVLTRSRAPEAPRLDGPGLDIA